MERPILSLAVTGLGAFSSIGRNVAETLTALRAGKSGVGEIALFDTGKLKVKHAAEISGYDARQYFSAEDPETTYDRTTQFAHIAAREAIDDSKLDLKSLPSDRVALVCGVCSGEFDLRESNAGMTEGQLARRYLERSRNFQTAALAESLGIHGPQASLSTACASSASALAYAYELLQSGRADVALVGGADGFMPLTYAGFYALGAMAEQPCSPFSKNLGVSFGEGAGCVVLEPLERAQARGAKIYCELAGYGSTADAYHYTSPHPSGEGLRRAMEAALQRSGAAIHEISYINAHGTGTRDNDTAESLAIADLCDGKRKPPPVSSTKSLTGHTLGAAGILEFVICVLASQEGFLPPTVNFESPRPGCELDYIANVARPAEVGFFLSNSAAFGGVNTVVAGRREPVRRTQTHSVPRIVITGIGVVSPAGCGMAAFRDALNKGSMPVHPVERFDVSDCHSRRAALVQDFKPRQLTPALDVRRLELITQYAAVSAGLAYSDACLTKQRISPEKLGAVIALAAGPVLVMEAFEKELSEKGLGGVGAKYFPAVVVSTIGGQVCEALGIKGLASTICDGVGAGLHGMLHACEMLRGSICEDQILVIAPDELGRTLFKNADNGGILSDEMSPYSPHSQGTILGEGSFALVLERLESAEARGARIYAEVLGYGTNCDPVNTIRGNVSSEWMGKCMTSALKDAATAPDEISFGVGLGRGFPSYDSMELSAFANVLSDSLPITSPAGLMGLAPAAVGTAALALGAMGLFDKKVYLPISPTAKRPDSFRKSLVFGGSEKGNNAAFVLGLRQ